MKPLKLNLTTEDTRELQRLVKRSDNWRIRERAEELLLLATGVSCSQVAEKMGLSRQTIETTRRAWFAEKFESLPDKPRPGAPRKIKPEEEKKILALADEMPLNAVDILKLHLLGNGTPVTVQTIRTALKNNDRVFKRTRHSLKKKRDEELFDQSKSEIAALLEKAQAGEMELMYLDEAGFSCIHPNRSAWTPKGEQHLIPAVRGKRLNVLGALTSSGYFEDFMFTGSMTDEIFLEFVKSMAEKYEKPITLILDNASFHKSGLVKLASPTLEKLGVTLKFIPPYCPELNRIEKLWHTIKHRWMQVKCRTFKELCTDLSEILDGFGREYKFDFYAK